MSIEKILTVLTMNRGEKLWMGQILKTKPQVSKTCYAQRDVITRFDTSSAICLVCSDFKPYAVAPLGGCRY